MAKIAPKGNKVTGTKKKDKITWLSSKAWKKALNVYANSGNDIINFKKSKYKNKLYGQAGNDTIYGGTKNDLIDGGAGKDKLYGYNGNDTLKGGKGNDYIDGGAGKDKIYGNYNANTLKGGASNDSIYGGTGTDKIYGGTGNDYINAGKGTNYIYLNKKEGTDTIANGKGKDTVIFSQEKNFDNFTFTTSGSDLKVSAGGTTAILKGFVAGKSSVVNVKAGNQSVNKVHLGDLDSDVFGTNGNDLFILNDSEGHYVHTGDGNDIIYAKDSSYSYRIYASKGNNYIDSSIAGTTYLFLKGMNGNNTIAPNWNYYTYIKFNIDEENDSSGHYEMLRQLQLGEYNTFDYVIGQKSGNDLVMKATNGKTFTVKDFYAAYSDRYIKVYDYDESNYISLFRGKSNRIFSDTPEVIQLTNEPAVYSNAKNKYIYGDENITYSLTMNNTSYNNIKVNGTGQRTINLQNAQLNYIETSGGQYNMTISGDNNYLWLGNTTSDSEFNITGNNNYIDTKNGGGISPSTFNLNGNGNYAWISAERGPIEINTQGQNKIIMTPEEIDGAPYFNVNSRGNDYFETGDMTRSVTENYDFNFTGSEGKNKEIETGKSNNINITGINDVGELKLTMEYSYQVIEHTYGNDYFTIRDYNLNSMSYNNSNSNGSIVTIKGTEGQGAADLNTTAMAAKIKVNSYQFDYEYHAISDLVQLFTVGGNNFTFGGETMGYMDNLTKNYLVYSSGTSANNTYEGFTFESGRHTIIDKGGDDTITINESNLETYDVRVYYNITAEGGHGNDLYFLKSSEYLDFMKGNDVTGYINVQDAFGQGNIEHVRVTVENNTFSLFSDRLTSTENGSLIQEVASWLTSDGRSFSDTAAVLSTGTDADKTALIAIFNKHAVYSSDCYNPYFDS